MLAHGLRNPLAPIRTGLQVLRVAESQDVITRTREMIERQLANLSRLIDDLLEVSRVTRGKIHLKKRQVDVLNSVAYVMDARSRSAAEKGLHLELLPYDGERVYVHADPTRLEQMIDNVLANAIKFTPAHGQISIGVARDSEEVLIQVRDTGIGIPSETLASVFDLFTQTRHTLDRAEGGPGIGLTVVRTLAQLHGGSVKALSEGEGKGTEVIIRRKWLGWSVPEALDALGSLADPMRAILST